MNDPSYTKVIDRFEGWIPGCQKRQQSVTADWSIVQELIDGVAVKEIRSVPGNNRVLTEVFRRDWELDSGLVDQVFQVILNPGGISAWHVHQHTVDRLFVASGLLKIVLYDARDSSPSHGRINEFRYGSARPALVSVPQGVWHGIKNISSEPCLLLNLVDRAYVYDDPDHWGVPEDAPEIPYSL